MNATCLDRRALARAAAAAGAARLLPLARAQGAAWPARPVTLRSGAGPAW